jgi:hypothetical protein
LLVGAVITTKEKLRPEAGAGSVDAKPASADRKYVVPDSAAVMTFVDVTVSTSAVPVTVPVTLPVRAPTNPLRDVTGPEKVVEAMMYS